MSRPIKGLLFLTMFVVAVAYWVGSQPKQPLDFAAAGAEISVDNPVAVNEFSLQNEKGDEIRLSQFKGKPILLNFWAAWCPPCVEELPSLLKLADWGRKNLGLVTLAVSADPSWEQVQKLFREKKFWPQGEYPLTILLNTDSSVATSYGSDKFPETYFISPDFKVIRKFAGPQNWMSEEITSWISQHSK